MSKLSGFVPHRQAQWPLSVSLCGKKRLFRADSKQGMKGSFTNRFNIQVFLTWIYGFVPWQTV
jgi:hypothetical protein